MSAESILIGLDKVRQTGSGRWVACCPAHEDRSPSLAIKQEADERVLIHCFAGCQPIEILNALGLPITELFPTIEARKGAYKRNQISAFDALICIEAEAKIVYTLAANLAYKGELSTEDKQRGQEAAMRIVYALNNVLR